MGKGIAGGERANSELMDGDDEAAMIGEGGEWIWRKKRVLLKRRKGLLEIRFRVWLKFKDFNANSDDDIANAFILFLSLFFYVLDRY